MLKRTMDIVGAGLGLVVLSPVLGIIALLIRWRLGRPVLFRQERLGLHERPFQIIKFRTMTDACGLDGRLLPDADRLTPLGRWLRASSVDELPELWNVILGDMSLVGPRPLPVSYRDRFRPDERVRHEVRPGITGWAQAKGRNTVDWNERLAMDVWYVRHRTLWLDLCVLINTMVIVLTRQGISAEGEATMRPLRPEVADLREDQ